MAYGLFFLASSALLGFYASRGGVSLILLWPMVTFLLVSLAYLGAGAKVLGKRSDGTIAPLQRIVLSPYFALIEVTWHLALTFTSETSVQEIAPGIWIGRRLLTNEWKHTFDVVVDLTSEFTEPRCFRNIDHYISVPVLDGMPPTEAAYISSVQTIAKLPGTVFIHCAQGHGRTSTFAALLLICRGTARDVNDALNQIRAVRPAARPNRTQRQYLERVALLLEPSTQATSFGL